MVNKSDPLQIFLSSFQLVAGEKYSVAFKIPAGNSVSVEQIVTSKEACASYDVVIVNGNREQIKGSLTVKKDDFRQIESAVYDGNKVSQPYSKKVLHIGVSIIGWGSSMIGAGTIKNQGEAPDLWAGDSAYQLKQVKDLADLL
jgi:hypothetical protein